MSALTDYLARSVATTGQLWGLGEYGLSEKISGSPVQTQPYIYGSAGGAYVDPTWQGATSSISAPRTSSTQTPVPTYPVGTTQTPAPQQPSASMSEVDQARNTLDLMNRGIIVYDDNLRSRLNSIISSGGGGGPSQEELIGQVYNPAFASLSEYEARLREGLPVQEEWVKKSSEPLLTDLETQRTLQQAEISAQQTKTEKERLSALGQARQLYTELQQGILSRFGAGTSTGPGAQEILGRELQKQFGTIGEQAGQMQEALGRQVMKLHSFVANERNRILTRQEIKLEELAESFKDELANINRERGALESAKAAARLDLLNSYRDRVAQLNYSIFQASLQLDTWRQQQQMLLTENFKTMPTGLPQETWDAYTRAVYSGLEAMPSYMKAGGTMPKATAPTLSYKLPTTGELTEEEEKIWNPYG